MSDPTMGSPMMPSTTRPKRTSPWVYVGVGCAILCALFFVVVGGVAFWGYRTFKGLATEMKDPVLRTQKVKEVLGCKNELPDGYHAYLKFSLPWIMDMAILSDREPEGHDHDHSKPFDRSGFVYVKTIRGSSDKKLRDYFEGKADAGDLLEKGNVRMTSEELVARGSFRIDDYTTYYTSHRGMIHLHEERLEGVTTLLFIDCPNDHKFRLGVWFGPDPVAAASGGHGAQHEEEKGESSEEAEEQAAEAGERAAEDEEGRAAQRGEKAGREKPGVTSTRTSKGQPGEGKGNWGDEKAGSAPSKDQTENRDGERETRNTGRDGDFHVVPVTPGPEYAGSPADERAMREFLSHFSPCGT